MSVGIQAIAILCLQFVIFSEQACSNGWDGPSPLGKCYKIMEKTAMPWTDADKVCKDAGAVLANIETSQEDAFISATVIPKASDWLVTGGRRQPLGASGQWTWSDGTPFTYANWGDPIGNPGGGGDATNDYMYLRSYPSGKGTSSYGKWFQSGPVTHQVLCQISNASLQQGCSATSNANCGLSYGCGCNRCGCGC